jgi:phage recombination protein Bet
MGALAQLSPENKNYIKQHYSKGATDQEFEHYIAFCQARGLNPAANQVYFVKYRSKDGPSTPAFMLSIDALRLIAHRTGDYAGCSEPIFTDGGKACTVTVQRNLKNGEIAHFSGMAFYEEQVQLKSGKPTTFWQSRPRTMLEKCAEAKALRKAFPQDLGQLYIREEMLDQYDGPIHVHEPKALEEPRFSKSDLSRRKGLNKKLSALGVDPSRFDEVATFLDGTPNRELGQKLKQWLKEAGYGVNQ